MDLPRKLVIIAADPLVRLSLASLFEENTDYEVALSTGPAVFSTTAIADPNVEDLDIVLWDFGWESGNLISLDFRVLDRPVVSLVGHDEQALEAWHAGCRVIMSRESEAEGLLLALEAAASGVILLDPLVSGSLLPTMPQQPDDLDSTPTAREQDVLQLLAEGLTNRAIADRLVISEHTVKFHVNAILRKLGAQSRTEAVVIATRLGLINL